MRMLVLLFVLISMPSLYKIKAQMEQLESPSPTSHSGCSVASYSSNSTAHAYRCTGGSETLSAYWTVNGSSYHNHADAHNSENYISEAVVPVEFDGTLIQCCLVPAVGNSDIQCCSTVVNIAVAASTTHPEPTTPLYTSTYYNNPSSLTVTTISISNSDGKKIQLKDSSLPAIVAATTVCVTFILLLSILLIVITFRRKTKGKQHQMNVSNVKNNTITVTADPIIT